MNYVFFIGGSGARVYTAFLHACAAGVIQADDVNAILLDADADNAACQKSCKLFHIYQDHRNMIYGKGSDSTAFHCKIQMYQEEAISPVQGNITHLNRVSGGNSDRERVLRWFYTEEELYQNLDKGFYAHPNIGCMFFQDFGSNPHLKKCLSQIANDVNQGKEPRVVIVGSVFGGTGAAGIPSILKIVEEACHVRDGQPQPAGPHFGGVLVTPYFKVAEAPCGQQLAIDSDKFYDSTKAALNYYRFIDKFEKTYLVGQKTLETVNEQYADGGEEQDNKPHIVEMSAAMAIKDFLEGTNEERQILGEFFDFENNNEPVTWDFFGEDMYHLADMLRAQMVLETAIYPCAGAQFAESWGGCYQWRWVYSTDSAACQGQLEIMQQYSRFFFEWLYSLQCAYTETSDVQTMGHLKLCDPEILTQLWNRVEDRVENRGDDLPEYKAKGWRKYQEDFINLVETSEKIEYVVEKVGVLLSALGVIRKPIGVMDCAILFLKLFGLVKHVHTQAES